MTKPPDVSSLWSGSSLGVTIAFVASFGGVGLLIGVFLACRLQLRRYTVTLAMVVGISLAFIGLEVAALVFQSTEFTGVYSSVS